MPHLNTVEAIPAAPMNQLTEHTGTAADDGRSAVERASWLGTLRSPDTSLPELNRGPEDVNPNPPGLDRPVAVQSRGQRHPGPQTYHDPAAQLLPDSAGLHAEIMTAVQSPAGEQNPAWTTRNTFRLPAQPWDATLYISPVEG